jgi:hypothetical protein
MKHNGNKPQVGTRYGNYQSRDIDHDTRDLLIRQRKSKKPVPPDPRQLSLDFDAPPPTTA